MKNKVIILIVAANLAILLLLAIFFPHLMISPGKPIDAHSELAENCFACHTPFIGSRSKKCIVCHKVEEIGIKTSKGLLIDKEKKNVAFHQKLMKEDCLSCHSDHKGVMAFLPISHFSHNLLDSTLQKQCDNCHRNPGDSLHLKVKGNCGRCHTGKAWSPATFDHKKHFRFDRHHNNQCATCHINNDYANYTCYGCHEHSRSKIREEHVEEGIYDYEICVKCHRSGDEDEAKHIWRRQRNESSQTYQRKSDHEGHGERDD